MDFVFSHMPFAAVAGVCALLGYVLPSRFLTVERAHNGNSRGGLFHWLRESLPLLIVAFAGSIGFIWEDPELQGWDRLNSVAYFTCAGVASLPAVSLARGMGYKIRLPGDSEPPNKP